MGYANCRRLALGLALATSVLAQGTPATAMLVARYTSGEALYYSVAITSTVGAQATISTNAELVMRILPGAIPGHFDAELSFSKYQTTVKADDSVRAGLEQQAATTDHAAQTMTPVRFRVAPDQIQVLSRAQGADYDQPVEMLEELARTDALPSGATAVGQQWTRKRSRDLPKMNFAVPLTLECQLTALGQTNGQPSATITIHSQGNTTLPPNALPGSEQLAAQGFVPEATVAFDTNATSQYRLADGVLLQSNSNSHNSIHIKLVGPSPQAREQDSEFGTTATVKLERSTGGS